jgi:hypothetical protein
LEKRGPATGGSISSRATVEINVLKVNLLVRVLDTNRAAVDILVYVSIATWKADFVFLLTTSVTAIVEPPLRTIPVCPLESSGITILMFDIPAPWATPQLRAITALSLSIAVVSMTIFLIRVMKLVSGAPTPKS